MRLLLLGVSAIALMTATAQAQTDPAVAPSEAAAPGNYLVFFEFDQADLTAGAQEVIAEAAAEYERNGNATLTITGHADRSGSADYNQALSLRRADAVQQELTRLGVPTSAVALSAAGESDPLVPTPDGVREARNRRVEVVVPQAPPPAPAVAEVEEVIEEETQPEDTDNFGISVGALYGYNFQEQDEGGTEDELAGVELTLRGLSFLGGLSFKQGILHSFNAVDEGFAGRSVLSLDFAPDLGIIRPYLSLNGGGVYGEGVQDGFVAGPEIGFDINIFDLITVHPKVAYDYQFRNSDWDEGILWGGLDLGVTF